MAGMFVDLLEKHVLQSGDISIAENRLENMDVDPLCNHSSEPKKAKKESIYFWLLNTRIKRVTMIKTTVIIPIIMY